MKLKKELLMAMGVLVATAGIATASEPIQAYAHPTLFGSQGHVLVTAESDVIVGGRIYKPCHVKTIENKQIKSFGQPFKKCNICSLFNKINHPFHSLVQKTENFIKRQ